MARCAPYWEKLAPHAEKAAAVLQAVLAQCQRAQPLWARAAEWLVPGEKAMVALTKQ